MALFRKKKKEQTAEQAKPTEQEETRPRFRIEYHSLVEFKNRQLCYISTFKEIIGQGFWIYCCNAPYFENVGECWFFCKYEELPRVICSERAWGRLYSSEEEFLEALRKSYGTQNSNMSEPMFNAETLRNIAKERHNNLEQRAEADFQKVLADCISYTTELAEREAKDGKFICYVCILESRWTHQISYWSPPKTMEKLWDGLANYFAPLGFRCGGKGSNYFVLFWGDSKCWNCVYDIDKRIE